MRRLVRIIVIGALAIGIFKIAMVNSSVGSVLAVLAVFGLFVWLIKVRRISCWILNLSGTTPEGPLHRQRYPKISRARSHDTNRPATTHTAKIDKTTATIANTKTVSLRVEVLALPLADGMCFFSNS
jgi:hypothetical protein